MGPIGHDARDGRFSGGHGWIISCALIFLLVIDTAQSRVRHDPFSRISHRVTRVFDVWSREVNSTKLLIIMLCVPQFEGYVP